MLERKTSRSSVRSEYMHPAQAGEVTLEREMRVSSTFHMFSVCSSEKMHTRARTCGSRSSGGRAPIERELHASRTFARVCSPLKRGKSRLSGAPLSACPLERRKPRSSETPVF